METRYDSPALSTVEANENNTVYTQWLHSYLIGFSKVMKGYLLCTHLECFNSHIEEGVTPLPPVHPEYQLIMDRHPEYQLIKDRHPEY